MDVDLTQVFSTLIAGGAIWAGIRTEVKFLWRDLDRVSERLRRLERNG